MHIALFPGQGSQFVGMGKDLFENFSLVRELFEEASDAAKKDFKKICFDGPEADLKLTENTQPTLLLCSVAAFRVAQKERDFRPQGVAGHSLGEYSALVAAGALPFSTAVAWVQERGRAMQKAVPAGEGAMAAIMGLEDAQITDLCKQATRNSAAKRASSSAHADLSVPSVVEPANFNAPGQIVIAGSVDAVEEAMALLKSGAFPGGKAIPLPVSAPFHCSLMRPARDRMADLFAKSSAKPQAPQIPYAPNRTARLTAEPGVVFELLIEQVDHPVLWKQTIEALLQKSATHFTECGPGKVLQGLVKRIAKPLNATPTIQGIEDSTTLKGWNP